MTIARTLLAGGTAALLAACQPGGDEAASPAGDVALPDADSTEAYAGVGEDETLRFTGTEPFWGGEATGASLTYSTPEDPDGTTIAVERFAGRGGLSFSGTLAGAALVMTVTPGACSDGMSDRSYPFIVTLRLGSEQRNGCGWSERQPFSGPAQP